MSAYPAAMDEARRTFSYNSETRQMLLDGQDIGGCVAGVEIVADYRGAQVVLHLAPTVEVSLTALADVQATTAGPSVKEFLDSVDAEKLEGAAFDRHTSGSLTPVMLSVLKEWSEGSNGGAESGTGA
jgi:hypothetical protein